MDTQLQPNSKLLFKAICIKRFEKEKCWPVLRPLVVYKFYICKQGYLSVYAEDKDQYKGRTHGLFWVNVKDSGNPIDFDEYFIKISEGEENGEPHLNGNAGAPKD
jgi:hypothetical protein